jgi:hypothetical protein
MPIGYDGVTWVAYFWFVGWSCISLGFHVCLSAPNIEIHLPFGFIRLGRRKTWGVRRRLKRSPSRPDYARYLTH